MAGTPFETHSSVGTPDTSVLHVNHLGQPVGPPLPDWTARPRPPRTPMDGRFCRLEPLDPARHAGALWEANSDDETGRMWTYLTVGPFSGPDAHRAWLESVAPSEDPLFHAIIDQATGRAVGLAAYLRIDPANGCLEVGHLQFSPRLQRRPAATEAMYLMMRRAFDDLQYRRYEWKCDSLNAPSRAAALRYGFAYEGLFRQAVVYKGRSRDTAWFSVTDEEWPVVKAAFEKWLAPENFDLEGQQRQSLATLRGALGDPSRGAIGNAIVATSSGSIRGSRFCPGKVRP